MKDDPGRPGHDDRAGLGDPAEISDAGLPESGGAGQAPDTNTETRAEPEAAGDAPREAPAEPDAAAGDAPREAPADPDAAGSIAEAPAPSGSVSMARGAYIGLVATAIAGIAVGAFFAGYVVSWDDDYVTRAQLESALASMARIPPAAPAAAPPAPPRPAAVSADDDPVLGLPSAPVTIVEFSDFECPFCSRFYEETLPLLKATYIEAGAAKLVYRDFPIDRIHPNARVAHAAAECADDQGMFWPYHDVLFERQAEWSGLGPGQMRERVSEYAGLLSLDPAPFEACVDSPATDAEIEADKRDGSSYGATGTPAFFVGNDSSGYVLISGAKPFDSFAAAIESALG